MVNVVERYSGKLIKEKILAHFWLEAIYSHPLLKGWCPRLFSTKWIARLVALYETSSLSRRAARSFIHHFDIDLYDFEQPKEGYPSFDAFFTRALKKGARKIDSADLILPCDGRYKAYNDSSQLKLFKVKNEEFSLSALLGPADDPHFHGGAILFGRLAPVDYHRVHMPLKARKLRSWEMGSRLYSVHPIATSRHPAIFQQNRRWVHLFQSAKGRFMLIEVGATCVGSMVHLDEEKKEWEKGEEFSYFRFGGSLVILLFEKGVALIDDDLLENTNRGYETLGSFGQQMGQFAGM